MGWREQLGQAFSKLTFPAKPYYIQPQSLDIPPALFKVTPLNAEPNEDEEKYNAEKWKRKSKRKGVLLTKATIVYDQQTGKEIECIIDPTVEFMPPLGHTPKAEWWDDIDKIKEDCEKKDIPFVVGRPPKFKLYRAKDVICRFSPEEEARQKKEIEEAMAMLESYETQKKKQQKGAIDDGDHRKP